MLSQITSLCTQHVMKPLQLQTEKFCLPKCLGLETPALVQSECLRRDQPDLWMQLNHSRFSRMENLTLTVSIPKNWFDSLDSSSSPFPLQTPAGVVRGMAGSDWLLTFFLKVRCSFPLLPALTGIDHITSVKAPHHSRASSHSPEGCTATPCSKSLQKEPDWGFMWHCLGRTDLRWGF